MGLDRLLPRRPPPLGPNDLREARPRQKQAVQEIREGEILVLELPSPKVNTIQKWFAKPHRFELEAMGEEVWTRCDGSKTVGAIAKDLASRHKMTLREAEAALCSFLLTLGKRGLIDIELPKTKKKR